MKTFDVLVQPDHLQRMTAVKRPILAVTELVWNGLDADATVVKVILEKNSLGVISSIHVIDNGVGMDYDEAVEAFRKLGGSWKRGADRTRRDGRILHGRAGKGRFRAFSLGHRITWITWAAGDGTVSEFRIEGSVDDLAHFRVSGQSVGDRKTGTEVIIDEVSRQFRSLEGPDAIQAVTEQLASYLREYAGVKVQYDGIQLDPSAVEDHVADYLVGPVHTEDHGEVTAQLTVVEWRIQVERSLFLCDRAGFALDRTTPGIQAPGFQFTAYLKSDLIRELDQENLLSLEDFNPALAPLVEAARGKLRDHFRERAAAAAALVVEDWKKEQVYPFEGEPANHIEETERQVFEVVALNVNAYLPDFAESDRKSKRFSLRLLRQALEENPESLQRILLDVLDLPTEKQDQLAQLLERTSLGAIIAASRAVADRLNFLKGLETLVFEPETKKILKERSQLHKILEHHTWIFGEQFNLTASDESLTTVLRRHLHLLRKDDDGVEPVTRADGSAGIVDLLLSRLVPQSKPERREHLVIELKRPSKRIDLGVVSQLESYAFAVAEDERFRDTETWWSFWAVSTDVDDAVRRKARQRDKPDGLIHDDRDARIQVWVKSWGQIIEECGARLKFFADRLEYAPDDQSALDYLRQLHAEYLPTQNLGDDGSQMTAVH